MKEYPFKITNVDDYIACQADELKEMLENIRFIILAAVPGVEETISYQVPCYKYNGMLVGFGTHKAGCSFYCMNTKILGTLSKELKGLKYNGSTVHFDRKKELPVALIKKIIKQRVKENKEKALLKQKTKAKK